MPLFSSSGFLAPQESKQPALAALPHLRNASHWGDSQKTGPIKFMTAFHCLGQHGDQLVVHSYIDIEQHILAYVNKKTGTDA